MRQKLYQDGKKFTIGTTHTTNSNQFHLIQLIKASKSVISSLPSKVFVQTAAIKVYRTLTKLHGLE